MLFVVEISHKILLSNHCSAMSNHAWCDLDETNILRLHDYCPNPKCKCQKQNTIPPNQFQIEGAGFKNTMKKNSK